MVPNYNDPYCGGPQCSTLRTTRRGLALHCGDVVSVGLDPSWITLFPGVREQIVHGLPEPSPPPVSDVEYLNNLALDREQNSIDVRSAAVKKMTDFDWRVSTLRRQTAT